MVDLSPQAKRILDYILEYKINADGNSPSLRQIAHAVGVASPSTIDRYLDELDLKGYIIRIPHRAGHVQVVGGVWTPPPEHVFA